MALTDQRHSEFHDTLYQLEPDVKDGPGALRDVWATRMMLRLGGDRRRVAREASPDRLSDAEEFLMRIRSGLHVDTGRNINVLSYELQEKAVDRLRYAGPDMRRRVEALMTDYFKDARSVTRALGRVRRAALPPAPTPIRLIGENLMWVVEGITFADAATAAAAPAEWLRVFEAAVSRNVPVADDALALMEREQQKHNYAPEVFHPTPEHQHRILQFMRPRAGLSARLSEMRDCGLLGAMFPELNEIACRVTRDFYHKYTVDEHTLLTVRNAERLLNNPRFAPILREVHAPELLVLALLYHDVGKAREGDHSIVGAEMAAAMSRRLGLDEDAAQTIDFLIRNHLKMSRIAFRRDTEEPEVVRQFASMFGTEEQLKMLVLLTLCDVGAVSPETLTPWKEELLWRLYVDAYNHMTLGYGDDIIDRDQALVAALQANRPRRHLRSRHGALPRGAAAAISDSLFAGRDLSSCQAVARHPAERGALLPREEGRSVGADGRLARQTVSVLEHLRRARVLRHGHSARARADQPRGARAGCVSICRQRRVFRAQFGRPARSSIAGCAKW